MPRHHQLSFFVAAAALLVVAPAFAQEDLEKLEKTEKKVEKKPVEKKNPEDISDQERWVGHLGFTYFGIQNVPIAANLTTGGATVTSVTAPFIGVRYWLQPGMGLDLGLGLGYQSASTDITANNTTTVLDKPATLATGIHAGLPLVLGRGQHYALEFIPELNIAVATATIKGTGGSSDISLSGSRIDVGARIGGEIFFGFIGVPELALQATIGLGVERVAYKASMTSPSVNGGGSQLNFATTVQSNPWSIFTNNIAATYYY
jgi:hypothetical protein